MFQTVAARSRPPATIGKANESGDDEEENNWGSTVARG
jgi:hypothetical protein